MVNTDDMIFVFGSNKAGVHGLGAAAYAKQFKGAVRGVGEGKVGQSYALPTKGYQIEKLPLKEVEQSVKRFLAYARHWKKTSFQVTQVGCGLGGFTKWQIAPLFLDAPDNCWFDDAWKEIFDPYDRERNIRYWGSYA